MMRKFRLAVFLPLLVALVCAACGDSAATPTQNQPPTQVAITPSVADLKQLMAYLTATQDALKKNDIAAAKAAYTQFDSRWYDQEDAVRSVSLDLYRTIENDMTAVGRALLRSEKPDVATVTTALAALQTSFAAGVNAAAKAPAATTKLAPVTGAEVDAATEKVKTYLIGQSDTLVKATTDFAATVRARDVATAKTGYTTARYAYESIEFLAEAFKELDVVIDARSDDFPNGEKDSNWTGFHPLEKALFVDNTLDARTDDLASRLVTDVTRLRDEIKKMIIDPSVAINGAASLIEEIQSKKITGEEERYSRTDLNDFRANLVSARFVYDSYAALVRQRNPVLDSEVTDRFAAVEKGLAPYIDAQGKAALYTAVDDTSRKALAQKVEALAESFSRVAPTLGIK